MGMSGDKVWDCYRTGEIEAIRNYCETDVLNTYLVYLRYELIRGRLTETTYLSECVKVRTMLTESEKPAFIRISKRMRDIAGSMHNFSLVYGG